jgi:hypothetical protein
MDMGDQARRFPSMPKRSLEDRLNAHPRLRQRFDAILDIAENVDGNAKTADEAERRAIEEIRRLGNEVLTGWAESREEEEAREVETREPPARVKGHGKKTSGGTRHSG